MLQEPNSADGAPVQEADSFASLHSASVAADASISSAVAPSTTSKKECPVTVAVRIRPPKSEPGIGKGQCVRQVEERNQVYFSPSNNDDGTLGRAFTYDHVFGPDCSQDQIYDQCVEGVLGSVMTGCNATVLAYGQTGSGKTYTMGTGSLDAVDQVEYLGIAPRLISALMDCLQDVNQRIVRVSYIELYQEIVRDLLAPAESVNPNASQSSSSGSGLAIREDRHGNIAMPGLSQVACQTKDDILNLLERGSRARTVGETNMNQASSRSHAIFSLLIEQYGYTGDQVECKVSKLHLVDLAGSERQKRTGADGVRFKESIKINAGLLALGNVINALSSQRESSHVPYRDSKLTRLLQDSLGGNCKTVLIACVSPMQRDGQETLNTLVYANRAKNIKNRPITNVTRAPIAQQAASEASDIVEDDVPAVQAAFSESPDVEAEPLSMARQTAETAVSDESTPHLVQQLRDNLAQAASLLSSLSNHKAALDLGHAVAALLADSSQQNIDTVLDHLKKLAIPVEKVTLHPPTLPPIGEMPHPLVVAPAPASSDPTPLKSSTSAPMLFRRSGSSTTLASKPLLGSIDRPDVESTLSRHMVQDLRLELERSHAKLEDAREQQEVKAIALSRAEEMVRSVRDECEYLRAKVEEAAADTRRAQNDVQVIEEQLAKATKDRAEAVERAQVYNEEAARLREEITAMRAEIERISKPAGHPPSSAEGAITSAGSDDELAGVTREMERKLALIQELDASRQRTDTISKKYKHKLAALEKELANTEKLVEKLQSEKIDKESERNKLKSEYEVKIKEITSQLTALRGRQKQHDKLLKEYRKLILRCKLERDAKEKQIQDLQTEVEKLKERQALLKRNAREQSDRLASAEQVHAQTVTRLTRQHDDDQKRIARLESQVASFRKRLDAKVASGAAGNEDGSRVHVLERERDQLKQELAGQLEQMQELEYFRANNRELRHKLRELARGTGDRDMAGSDSMVMEPGSGERQLWQQPGSLPMATVQ